MKLLPGRLLLIGLIVLGFAAIIATPAASLPKGDTVGGTTTNGQATALPEEYPPKPELVSVLAASQPEIVSAENLSTLPPPAEQDPCLHCHITGEIVDEWTPISRWFVFGAMGLTFIFGVTRNLTVWRTRELWHHRWMYHLGRIAAFFFILQASTGIILLFFYQSTPETIIRIMSLMKALHWGSGIALFIATLSLSLAGYLLPWYQRAFWGLIFITEIIGGALAIANLSFAYLYADWHIPPSPSRLYAFHMLLIPIAIASIMSIYFMMLRKRGETT